MRGCAAGSSRRLRLSAPLLDGAVRRTRGWSHLRPPRPPRPRASSAASPFADASAAVASAPAAAARAAPRPLLRRRRPVPVGHRLRLPRLRSSRLLAGRPSSTRSDSSSSTSASASSGVRSARRARVLDRRRGRLAAHGARVGFSASLSNVIGPSPGSADATSVANAWPSSTRPIVTVAFLPTSFAASATSTSMPSDLARRRRWRRSGPPRRASARRSRPRRPATSGCRSTSLPSASTSKWSVWT